MHRSLRRLMAGLVLLAASSSARAIAIWPSMPGSWPGLAQSSATPVLLLPAVLPSPLEVRYQTGGTFIGTISLPAVQTPGITNAGPTTFRFVGSVSQIASTSPSERVSIFGRSTDGGRYLLMYGTTVAMGDGSVRVAALRYGVFNFLVGLLDQGYVLTLQRVGGLSWMNPGPVPDVTGMWSGTFDGATGPAGGSLTADLMAITGISPAGAPTLTSGFIGGSGGLQFESSTGIAAVNITLPAVQGTVGLPAVQSNGSMASPLAMIASGPGATATQPGVTGLLIGLLHPPSPNIAASPSEIDGSYQLFGSLADVFDAFWTGSNTSFADGSFSITK